MPRITKSMAARLAEHKPSLSQAALHSFITPDNQPHPSKVNPNFYVLDIR